MKTAVDRRLRVEVVEFELRYACEHCAHFDPASEACSQGFPNEDHRQAPLDSAATLTFCKSFELA
jgi:hypothetical protein